jgi:hypothetical protein
VVGLAANDGVLKSIQNSKFKVPYGKQATKFKVLYGKQATT